MAFTVAGLLSFLVGFMVSDQGWSTSAKRLARNVFLPTPPEPGLQARSISTGFLRLDLQPYRLSVSRPGEGGGLTSVGDDLLIITHDGAVIRARDNTIESTRIKPPENHFDVYKAEADSGKYADLRHEPLGFRYNDVLYFEEDSAGHLIVSYTEWRPGLDCYTNTLARVDLGPVPVDLGQVDIDASDWVVFFRTMPCLPLKSTMRALAGHVAGGRIALRSPGRVLLGSGDYHWDGLYGPAVLAQDSGGDYGKVLEVDLATGDGRHLSLGNRNVQGILVDRYDRVWAVEHGPRGGDELNLIEAGGNYGWPLATLGTRYNSLPWPTARQYGRHEDFDPPVFAWVPSIGVSNIMEIEGFDPSWDGDLLVSSLAAQTLFRLRLRDDRVLFAEPIEIGDRIRYAHQHSDGRIALLASNARLIWMSRSETTTVMAHVDRLIEGAGFESGRTSALRTAVQGCIECHSFEPGNDGSAPSLGDVFGRRVAATPYSEYSAAFRLLSGRWSEGELVAFIADPQSYAPGTTMPASSLSAEQVNDLVDLLRRLSQPD